MGSAVKFEGLDGTNMNFKQYRDEGLTHGWQSKDRGVKSGPLKPFLGQAEWLSQHNLLVFHVQKKF